MDRKTRWIAGGAGAAVVALFAAISRIDHPADRTGLFLGLFGIAFAAYAVALFARNRSGSRRCVPLLYVFAVAAASRAVLVPAVPEMSTDIYRYVWEGRVAAAGHNPFALAPDAPELNHLRDGNYEKINHRHHATIYPPVSQAVFALAARLKPVPEVQKIFFVLFDLGAVAALMLFLRGRGLDPGASVVYAWNPLVIFETGHSGHVDSVGIFFLVLALWWLWHERRIRGFLALGVSFLCKYLAVVFVPYYLRSGKYARWLPVFVLAVAAGYLPFAGAGTGLVASLRVYGTQWHFNGPAYDLLSAATGSPDWARGVLLVVLAAVVGVAALRARDVLRYGFVVVGAGLLLAPTVYPWYVSWIVPFLCFFPNRAWILFTGLVFVSYRVWDGVAAGGAWELPWFVLAAEYAPFYGLLAYDTLRARRRRTFA